MIKSWMNELSMDEHMFRVEMCLQIQKGNSLESFTLILKLVA
jgi:hypothetical protein